METDDFIKVKQKFNNKKNKNLQIKTIIYIIFVFILFATIFICLYFLNDRINKNNADKKEMMNELIEKMNNLEQKVDNLNKSFSLIDITGNKMIEEFDENIKNKIFENQGHFCQSNDLFRQPDIDTKIRTVKINFENVSFSMHIYRNNDYISNQIAKIGSWEKEISINFLKGLQYYSDKKQLSKNQVTVLDIGANLGWYTYLLSNAGYELISFEASHINDYILKKTFCLNQNINVTLINKGIGLENEKCILQHPSYNVGNAVILCGENAYIKVDNQNREEIEFTKLSNYIPYLSNKNLALIKIDVEGAEGKVVKSGIELITKYHIPFIYIEFTTDYLKMQGTNPRELLEIFENNGYSISTVDFISKNYTTIDKIVNVTSKDLYLVYSKFLE